MHAGHPRDAAHVLPRHPVHRLQVLAQVLHVAGHGAAHVARGHPRVDLGVRHQRVTVLVPPPADITHVT